MPTAREKADKLKEQAAAAYARTDSDPRLNAQTKRDEKIREFGRVARALKVLQQQDTTDREQHRLSLERRLFGLPTGNTASDKISYRDAQDRAARLKDANEAALAMDSARSIGDTDVIKAIALRAVTLGWVDVINTYVDKVRPDLNEPMSELFNLNNRSTATDFTDYLAFVPPEPSGVGGMNSAKLESEANRLEAARDA